MPEIDAIANPADPHRAKADLETGAHAVQPVFIHAAPRSSSTWFWAKFRENPATLCYYEPFNDKLLWLTPDRAETLAHDSWESRHTRMDPYYREYLPLIRKTNGVELFDPAMAFQWFIPEGGLRGELRPAEKDYVSLLLRHADERGKAAVLGGWRSLGRAAAIKKAFGGVNIFQYRNLWQQWLSMLSFKRRGSLTFCVSVVDTIFGADDPYFSYLVERGLARAADPRTGRDRHATGLTWTRSYPNLQRDEEKVRRLELLPEQHAFALYMGLHIYLYLHAQLSCDLAADVTRMARDTAYRGEIERVIRERTGLSISFADAADPPPPPVEELDTDAIDWGEVREYAAAAVRHLDAYGDPARLAAAADQFIDDTMTEFHRVGSGALMAASAPARTREKTIGLCMIVKNETKVLRRCLDSVRPLVDYMLVVDTGSSDGTQQMVRDYLAETGMKGAVVEEPWQNFAYNRTFALERLREEEGIDYALMIDADDVLESDAGFDPAAFKRGITQDLYDVPIRYAGLAYARPQICSNRKPFYYKGVLHEYVEGPPGGFTRGDVAGFAIRAGTTGARSQNPRKYQDDAALLERALATETDPFLVSRYTFYLAQSYKDCGENEKALPHYLKRAELGYWNEEVYVSLLEAGNLMAALDRPFDDVIATYERATKTVPTRAEALHAASLYCRNKGKNAEGVELARRGLELKQPASGLFVHPWIYEYGLLDEFAINAYWAGAYRQSLDASLKLLVSDTLPASMVKRVAANARFAADKLPTPQAPHVAVAAVSTPATPVFKACPVCGATGTTKPRSDLEPHPYARCEGCGLFYQPNMRSKVFEGHHEARADHMSPGDREANRLLAASFYRNHLVRRLKERPLLHLDIGSKYPFFGHCLQRVAVEHGDRLISHGIDGVPEAHEFGRKLDVLMAVGDFEAEPATWDMPPAMRQRIAHGGFHCVSLIHCLEHFYNPLPVLRKIRGLMADGGILFIRSPDSQAPGIEGDFTLGHYDIHPTIWCKSAMDAALAGLQDAFTIYETYELAHQRDYLLLAGKPRAAIAPHSRTGTEANALGPETTIAASAGTVVNILRPGAIGDVVLTSAVTAQLAADRPDAEICYYTKFPEMAKLLVGVQTVFDSDAWDRRKPGRDLIPIGYPIAEGYPERPMQKHLAAYFCEEANLPPGLPQLRDDLEPFEIKERLWMTIHPTAGWSVYKEWDIANWNEIVAHIHETYPGVAIVQIGGKADAALQGTDHDLRGRTSISQASWLVKNSVLHLGVDTFTNHVAGAFRHPAVIVFGSTSPTGSGYQTAVNLWAGLTCSPCYREDPRISRQSRGPCINPPGQAYDRPRHACMAAVAVEAVWEAIESLVGDRLAPAQGGPLERIT